MKRTHIALITILALVLTLSIITYANAIYCTSFIYPTFCTTLTTAEALDQTYTDINVVIKNVLAYKNATSPASKITIANTTSATKKGISVYQKQQDQDANLIVYLLDASSEFEIVSARWNTNETITVKVSDFKLTISKTSADGKTKTNLLEGLSYTLKEGYSAICAAGAAGTATGDFTSGYVQVDVTISGETISGASITSWLPTILSLAMLSVALGMVFGMIKRFS